MVDSTVNAIWGATVSGIVRPAPKVVGTPTQIGLGPRIPFPRVQQWAPAWFYSALNWLGKMYYDANNVAQIFSSYMAGSDVDPYEHIGSTRLFLIVRIGEGSDSRWHLMPIRSRPRRKAARIRSPTKAFARCTCRSRTNRSSRA